MNGQAMRAKDSCRRACENPLCQSQIVALVHVTFQPVLVREYSLAFLALAGPSAPPLALILQLCKATRAYYWGHEYNLKEWHLFVVPACIGTRTSEDQKIVFLVIEGSQEIHYFLCNLFISQDPPVPEPFSQM